MPRTRSHMPWSRAWLVALVLSMLTTSTCWPAVSTIPDVELCSALARHAQNVTLDFWARRSSNASACWAPLQQGDLDELEGLHFAAAADTLQQYETNITATYTVTLRVQLDFIALAPDLIYYVSILNQRIKQISVVLDCTPPAHQPPDVHLTGVSSPQADARITDTSCSGDHPGPDSASARRDGSPFFMFYRTDVLSSADIPVPESWEELLEAAQKLNGTDFDGDGVPDRAVCFSGEPICMRSLYVLISMLGPMLQAAAPSQGVFFDPLTMHPLMGTPAMRQALKIYASLSTFADLAPGAPCSPYSVPFATGRCAITFSQDQYLHSAEHWPNVSGHIGTALTPGSPYVLDRSSNTLQSCTPQLCPLGSVSSRTQRLINRAPLHTAYSSRYTTRTAATLEAQLAMAAIWRFVVIHCPQMHQRDLVLAALGLHPEEGKAPAPGTSEASSGGSTATAEERERASTTRSLAASPAPPTPRSRRREHEEGTSEGSGQEPVIDPQPLVAAGYNLEDTLSFLRLFYRGYTHPNMLLDIALPGATYYRSALAAAALNATTPEANLSQIMTTLDAQFAMYASAFHNDEELKTMYQVVIGANLSSEARLTSNTTPAAATAAGKSGRGVNWRGSYTGAILGSVGVLLLAVALQWAVLRARHSTHTLLGAVKPPGVGPSTTLLVTDMQNSTAMWEQLPMALMEEVLRVHHRTLRALLDLHRGYESATEGDSFILAFHSPSDALAYALEAQQALLAAAWPDALLETFPEAAVSRVAVCTCSEAQLSHVTTQMQAGASLHRRADTSQDEERGAAARLKRLVASWAPGGSARAAAAAAAAATSAPSMTEAASSPAMQAARRASMAAYGSAGRASMAAPGSARRASMAGGYEGRGASVALPRSASLRLTGDGSAPGGGSSEGASTTLANAAEDICATQGAMTLQMPSSGDPSTAAFTSTDTGNGDLENTVLLTGSSSFGCTLAMAWTTDEDEGLLLLEPAPRPRLKWRKIWRGVRVRMGIHSGLDNALHVSFNTASHRAQYSGDFASTAKCVGDAGSGGQIVLSGPAFMALTAEDRKKAGAHIMLMGDYVLKGGMLPQPLYQAAVPGLEARLPALGALRAYAQVSEGILQAPVGGVTVVFVNAVGVQTLLGWNAEVAQQALRLYHDNVAELVQLYGGYVAELVDGLGLVVFQQPEHAIAWALATQVALTAADWPQQLLEHELCEPVTTTLTITSEVDGCKVVDTVNQVCSRGLRIKVGIDSGAATDSVHPATGRMAYRGKVMNRAARIAAAASIAQVLCSSQTWEMAMETALLSREGVVGSTIGLHALKGIHKECELYCCTYAVGDATGGEDEGISTSMRTRAVRMRRSRRSSV